jgi:glycosyltransferase involved in cell wall biosynthesis
MNKDGVKLSVVVIAKDEEKMIGECLDSVAWADEVIVVDHGSIDKTARIAKKKRARVLKLKREDWPNFSRPRNEGLRAARGEWVLYLDADERVDKNLREEIEGIIEGPSLLAWYAIPRLNVIFGQEFRHGGWWPDYVKRFYRRKDLKGWKGELHEEPQISGEMGYLKNSIRHIKHESVSEMIEKTNNWSEIEAKLMFDAGHPKMNVPRFVSAMWREFFYRMVRKMAFLDGAEGIMMAMYQVYSRFISYAKLWEMQEREGK